MTPKLNDSNVSVILYNKNKQALAVFIQHFYSKTGTWKKCARSPVMCSVIEQVCCCHPCVATLATASLKHDVEAWTWHDRSK